MFTATHLHAMVIHFPIALVLIGYIFEIISLFSKNIFHKTYLNENLLAYYPTKNKNYTRFDLKIF